MKTANLQQPIFENIKKQLLSLPEEERKKLSDSLISFLLFDVQSASTPSHDLKCISDAERNSLTLSEIKSIRELGKLLQHLDNQAGDDLYFFM